MKKLLFLLLYCFMLFSCSKDSTSTPVPEIRDDIKPPYIVKYEVSFSTNQTLFNNNTLIEFSHEINGDGIWHHWSEQGNYVSLTKSQLNGGWSRTFTVTVSNNPLALEMQTNFNPASDAIVYFKIYVNNVLVKNAAVNVSPNTNTSYDVMNDVSYLVY